MLDTFPSDGSESWDTDNDGIGNNADLDDDNDDIPDDEDLFLLVGLSQADLDGDGIAA